MRVERRFTDVGGYRFYSVHSGAGPPVVLLHGLSGSARWWRHTLPALAEGYSVHIPDLIGFGRSRRRGGDQPDIPTLARLLVAWLDAQGLDRTHLVGHSMGGQLSVHIAASHPTRIDRLVLVSAAGIPRPRSVAELARFVAEMAPPRAWGRLTFLPTIATDALRAGPRVLWRATRHLLADDIRPLLPRIVHPTLLVWGRLDPLTPVDHGRIIAESIPGARLVIFEDAAHNPMADRPAAFNELVVSFLAGADGAA